MIVAGVENRPPMLDKSMYNSWQSQNGAIRSKKYVELTAQEQLQDDCDVQATNIVLQGLPPDVYSLVNHHQNAKEILNRVKLLMKGTELSYQEREFQVNTKFLNALQPEWSKFVTDVKLAKNLYTTNYDQLYAYLSQHKGHANKVQLLHERYPDPLALVANHQTQSHSAQYPQQLSSTPQPVHSSQPYLPTYEAPHHPQQYQHAYQPQISHPTPSVPQNAYHSPPISPQPQTEFPQLDSGLAVLVFLPGDDPIACLNKAMAFMSTVVASRFPSTNNQLRTSSNPRNQATIQDGRVTVQQVQGRQGQSFAGMGTKGNATSSGGNNAAGQARVVKCYNCQGEGHMARQCTKPKRPRNSAWFKEKMLLVQAQESGQVLDEEQLAFLVDPEIPDGQAIQKTIPQNTAFQTDDLDAYNSACDDISSEKRFSWLIYLMSEQMSNQVTHWDKVNQETKNVNESLTTELEIYKERFKTFEERLNVDLSSQEKLIDSQMDDMIWNMNALKQEINSLKQTLSKQV
ncbi:retrovirus-related pol polyprotein from transposon TNT 1-94 [Tanacetum coccineum]